MSCPNIPSEDGRAVTWKQGNIDPMLALLRMTAVYFRNLLVPRRRLAAVRLSLRHRR